jgi:protease PrsW
MNTPVPSYVLIAAAIAPAIALLFLLSFQPKSLIRWEARRPLVSILLAVLTGVGSAFLALGAENLLTLRQWSIGNLGGLALFTVIVAGVSEEGAKYLCVRLYSWRSSAFRERYDGILYCAAVGLGFGAAENVSYVLSGGLGTALIRALTAVPFHGLLGVLLGYFLGQSKVKQLAEERWGFLHWQGLAWAVAAHGLYDFFAFQAGLLSVGLLSGFLGGLAIWGIVVILKTRSQSPSWGGGEPPPPPPFVAPPIKAKNPILAGLLGLIPGLGQFYNGEVNKGLYLVAAGVINAIFLAAVYTLLTAPLQLITFLFLVAQLKLTADPQKFYEDLSASPILPLLVTLNIGLCLFSAWDAYRTAKAQQFDYLQAPEKRRRFVQAFSTSYLGHLLAVFAFILVPVLTGGGASGKKSNGTSGGGNFEFDIVSAPTKLDGFSGKPEGTPKGVAKKTVRRILVAKRKQVLKKKNAAKAPAVKPQIAQDAKGLPSSYNEYLSYKIRRYHDLYFDQITQNSGEYTVVQYEIDAVGNVTNVQVLYEHTTAPHEVAELAADTVRSIDPALPLPEGVQSVTITELFWDGTPLGEAGSLEERLSHLPDGREVVPYPAWEESKPSISH